MTKFITQFASDFITIMAEMAPYLLIGFFFAGILRAFLPQRHIRRLFTGHPFLSSLYASLIGIPMPLCSCGVIPTGTALYKNGADKSSAVSFLISTPQTGIDSLLATYALMGLPMMIIRPITSLITGVLGGTWTGYATKHESNKTTECPTKLEVSHTLKEKIKIALRYGFVDFMQDTSKWLVVGLVLAALISVIIPNNLMHILNLPPFVQMIMVLFLSIPFYICATGSIPLAAMLMLKGLSPGAAFILLMAGPATNVATMTMIGKVMGRKTLIIYLASIAIGAVATGLLIDYGLPANWFTATLNTTMAHGHSIQALPWFNIVSAIILALLIINGYITSKRTHKKAPIMEKSAQILVVKVEGMTCNHCKKNVESHLEDLERVQSANVHLANKTVTIQGHDMDIEEIRQCVEELGYSFIQ